MQEDCMEGKWYRHNFVKGFLIFLAEIMAILMIISMIWILSCPGAAEGVLEGSSGKYEESHELTTSMYWDASDIIYGIRIKQLLGDLTDKKNLKRVVDIETFDNKGKISGKNESGLAYTLGDLLTWRDKYFDQNTLESGDMGSNQKDPVIVCKKPEGGFDYYRYSEFEKKIDDGEFRFVMESEDTSPNEYLRQLKDGSLYKDSYDFTQQAVLDAEKRVLYTQCWNYDGFWLEECVSPVNASDLLDLVNKNKTWNGNLQGAYDEVFSCLSVLNDYYINQENLSMYNDKNSNLVYLYVDDDGHQVYTNREEYSAYGKREASINKIKGIGKYIYETTTHGKLSYDSNIAGKNVDLWDHGDNIPEDGDSLLVAVDTTYPVRDSYYVAAQSYDYFGKSMKKMIVLGVLGVIFFLTSLIWLTVVSGRRVEDEELHLVAFDRWKTEIAAGIMFAMGIFGVVTGVWWVDYNYQESYQIYRFLVIAVLIGVVLCGLFLIGYLSLVRRIKAGTVWSNSLCRWLLEMIPKALMHIPTIWKSVLGLGLFVLAQAFMWTSRNGLGVMIGGLATIVAFVYVVGMAIGRKRIADGIERIAGGEVDYKIPLTGLRGRQLLIAQKVNSIGEGLDAALEDSMKNERMKTDLITNVSHDIKTPLTSIIDYIDLLKRENIEDEKIQGYLAVLEEKSQRLKILTEDVVEASKVSSGNISLEYANLDLVEMVRQTSGEFAEKFEKRNLQEVLTLPEEPAIIRVDGRRMWRILENIYNNAAKYAMEGTRVYADLKIIGNGGGSFVEFSLKNISEQPLNISADELMERFVRGDVSRTTEGSGLGLSIARNLAELMGGKFDLYLDGDLFRVTIKFPAVIVTPLPDKRLLIASEE